MANILCIDDEPAIGVMLERALGTMGHEATLVTSIDEGMRTMARTTFDLVITDFQMPGGTGHDLLRQVRSQGNDVPVIVMTGYSTIEHAVQTIRSGATDYLTKPIRMEALRMAVTNSMEVTRLRKENESFRQELNSLKSSRPIIGESPVLKKVMQQLEAVAPTKAAVLLGGESGTGKELLARAIHEKSGRQGDLITVNCAALPEGLVESVLFGHEKGAFTGATIRSLGAFERAHGGTLLLDEITEMRLDLQSKLLRAIQEQEFERVGGTKQIKVDVRIIATTNRDLSEEVRSGRFRQDLYYRLNVVPLVNPPLREREGDIRRLVEYYLNHAAEQVGIRPPTITPETMVALESHSWPGNIRELANAIERAVILNRSGTLRPEDFGLPDFSRPITLQASEGGLVPQTLNLDELEKITITAALAQTGGNRTRAARILGISERTLRNKLNTRGLPNQVA
jgi:DNA-binding NtrC family response regulator